MDDHTLLGVGVRIQVIVKHVLVRRYSVVAVIHSNISQNGHFAPSSWWWVRPVVIVENEMLQRRKTIEI